MREIFLVSLLSLLLSPKTIAQSNLPPAYEIKTDTTLTQYLDNNHWQMLGDRDSKWSIGQVSNLPLSNKFHKRDTVLQETDTAVITYWFRYRLKNVMNVEAKISLDAYSEQDDFYVFEQKKGYTHFLTGSLVPWAQKEGLKLSNSVPLILQPGEEVTIYDRASNKTKGIAKNLLVDIGSTEKIIQRDYINYIE